MKERPILFSGEMVRAILAGRKIMTRRVVHGKAYNVQGMPPIALAGYDATGPARDNPAEWGILTAGDQGYEFVRCPCGGPGDRLWVRETWRECGSIQLCNDSIPKDGLLAGPDRCRYKADGDWDGPWRPSIFMPRWASRITLVVTGVRAERLQDISEDDARHEGAPSDTTTDDLITWFRELWDSINGKRGYGWDMNPWVWVVEFRRTEA